MHVGKDFQVLPLNEMILFGQITDESVMLPPPPDKIKKGNQVNYTNPKL